MRTTTPNFRGFLFSGLLLAATTTATAGEWTQFRNGPEQRGIAAGELPPELELAWTFELEDGTESTPAIADGRVYVPSLGGQFYALDLVSGEEIWVYETGEEIKSSPLVHDGTIYFGDEFGGFHALDARTGERRFKLELDGAVSSSANFFAAGDKSCVLFGSYDASIYCVAPQSGDIRWQYETQGYVHGTPALWNGKATSSGCDGFLRLIDAASGEEAFELSIGSYVAASPAVRDHVAYLGTFDNKVLAVDLDNSKVLWEYDHPERDFPFYSSAAVTEDLVIVGGRDKMVHAIDRKTGQARWTRAFKARVDASPVVVGDRVYVADESGVLAALALLGGEILWEFESGSSFIGSPAVADGHLLIGTVDGLLFAFTGPAKPSSSSSSSSGDTP